MLRDKKPFVDRDRAKITRILKRASPPPDNLTPQERKVISKLKSFDNIVFLEANKGDCTVVIHESDYTTKMMTFLNDRKTYKVLTSNPEPFIERRFNCFIWKLKQGEKYSSPTTKAFKAVTLCFLEFMVFRKSIRKLHLCAKFCLLLAQLLIICFSILSVI